jgi:hypothetical protein
VLLLAAAVPLAAQQAGEGKRDPRLDYAGKLIESSSAAKKVEASGNAEAMALREQARGLFALAVKAQDAGDQATASEYLNQAIRRREVTTEEDVQEAVIEGALLRIRPVIMTVAATIGGLLPIMFGSGTGSEVMRRIAAPMVGGMVSATILTLAVIPALFLLWRRRSAGRA